MPRVQFSRSVMSVSLWPHRLQHARPSCPSPTPGVYSKSCPLSRWCHPTISSSVIPVSSRLQSFPASVSCSWFNILAVQGTLKSLLQHHSLKSSILLHWAFFMVQLAHPYLNIYWWSFKPELSLLRGWLVDLEHLLKCWLICFSIFLTFIKSIVLQFLVP